MVYCSKCGNLNPDEATICSKCRAPLNSTNEPSDYWRQNHKREREYRRKNGGFSGLLIGLIIIVIGLSFLLSEIYGISIPWWPLAIIIVGIWLLIRAVIWRRR
jgi:uncharacterized membrane protein YvbJ